MTSEDRISVAELRVQAVSLSFSALSICSIAWPFIPSATASSQAETRDSRKAYFPYDTLLYARE